MKAALEMKNNISRDKYIKLKAEPNITGYCGQDHADEEEKSLKLALID